MRKGLMLFCVLAVSAGLVLWTCSKKNNNPTGPGGGGNNETMVMNYAVSGDTIFVYQPQDIYTYSYCNGNTLITGRDTSSADTMIMIFNVSGNTLSFHDTGSVDLVTCTRVGSGSGLIGMWIPDDTSYDMPDTLVFDAYTITAYGTGNGNSSCSADDYVQYEWYYDTVSWNGNLNGTIAELSCNQVRITGSVTNEKVTITWNSSGDMTYTSSSTNPARTPYTYYETPTTCPDNYVPDWFWSYPNGFMTSNQKGISKRAVAPSAALLLDIQKKMILLKHKHKHLL